jgi:hypothetical protein
MSFIVGDEIITDETPEELKQILDKLKENTKVKVWELMKTIAKSDKLIAYIIPEAGMVVFANEIKDENKVFRFLVGQNGALYIDNKQRKGEMFCPLFSIMEEEIKNITGREAETVTNDSEYRVYDSFMPKIVETINQIFITKPKLFNQ